MSKRYPGGIITKNPATPTGPFDTGTAPGIWTLEQQMQFKQQGVWPLAGNTANFIEDVFSTFLYTGTGAAQTITNNIDLSTKGGLVWIKDRSNAESHSLWDTARGVSAGLQSNANSAQYSDAISLTAYNSNGFSLGTDANVGWVNRSPDTYVSWTFREQPKFFDVVTYTGNGTAGRTVAHNLGSVPGFMIVKNTSNVSNWFCWHRTMPNTDVLRLNSTIAQYDDLTAWNSTTPTSTIFTVGTSIATNNSGDNYVAYLFAHDAGGFGLAGTDNVISCGSFSTGAGGGATVTLGYEPQWLMIKSSSNTSSWYMFDTMRGWVVGAASRALQAQVANAEFNFGSSALPANPTATGFTFTNGLFAASETWIYVAIRRGPMKVPTLGTSVFSPIARNGTGGSTSVTGAGFPPDFVWIKNRAAVAQTNWFDKLRGPQIQLLPANGNPESSNTDKLSSYDQDGFSFSGGSSTVNGSGTAYINYCLRRAPGYFDEVCFTSSASGNKTFTHNLGVSPELMILKNRQTSDPWIVYSTPVGNNAYLSLNTTDASSPNASSFSVSSTTVTVNTNLMYNSQTYVAYLFATVSGVSKVGSYTGTGALQTVACGFTTGARFVLIKRTDSTGDWYYWDSARGLSSGDDPYLLLNVTDAEVTNTNYVDTDTTGFKVTAAAPAAINANGGSFIFLAIA